MDRRSIQMELIPLAILLGWGLLVSIATPAGAQSVKDTVQQRMDAGAAAIESTAGMAEEPAAEQPESPAPSAEPPAIQIQPMPAEPASDQGTTDQEATSPESEPSAEPPADQESSRIKSIQAPAAPAESSEPAPAPADVAAAEPPPAPPTYTVKPGDTLWSISSEALSDPFNWPKLWNVNPTVNNPDLIYPGNVLMLPNGHPAETVEAEPAPPVAEAPPAETMPEETAMTEEEAPAAPAEEKAPPAPEERQVFAETTEEQVPEFEVLPPLPSRSKEILAQSSGFIARNLPVAARVVGTHDNRYLLGDHDTIYLLPTKGVTLEAQGRYTIYRRVKPVVHPVSRRVVGDLIQILGEAEVSETGAVSTATVVKSFASIEPGDYLMPARTVEAQPTTPVVEGAGGSLSGLVLEVMGQHYLIGEFNIVYIDRGESSGVVVGDHFRVYRHGERTPSFAVFPGVRLPDRQVGDLEILSVQGDTATALLTGSSDTVALGDRIER